MVQRLAACGTGCASRLPSYNAHTFSTSDMLPWKAAWIRANAAVGSFCDMIVKRRGPPDHASPARSPDSASN
eukprot:3310770-Prymnesium_polylepis.1